MRKIIVIGAGIGGLTTAAALARFGQDVTVLEAQVYPGGCASTFYHQGYFFDSGATLAGGFYEGGPMDLVAKSTGIQLWPIHKADPAMSVHLPNGKTVHRWADQRRWEERRDAFGSESEPFWHWQESTAEAMWRLALRLPPWPPRSISDLGQLLASGVEWLGEDLTSRLRIGLLMDTTRPVASHLKNASKDLRIFIDAQLLISAQTTSPYANALFGASALDLPRRGVVHLKGGMGSIAQTFVQAIQQNNGQVHLRQEVTRVVFERGKPVAVQTKRGDSFPADMIVFNLPIWNISQLIDEQIGKKLIPFKLPQPDQWGAFVVYLGVDNAVVPKDFPLHHQIIEGEPLGEGKSIFLSISPEWDDSRSPRGKRAITLSTHTLLSKWWNLHNHDQQVYEIRKKAMTDQVIATSEIILPGLAEAAEIVLPGTPVTFQRFTGRVNGWVGGFQQTNLFQFRNPRIPHQMWMVGDSIFPGQSSAAVAMGGLRVAREILEELFGESPDRTVPLDAKAQDLLIV
jgi:C-3',4' desaturase CrtD